CRRLAYHGGRTRTMGRADEGTTSSKAAPPGLSGRRSLFLQFNSAQCFSFLCRGWAVALLGASTRVSGLRLEAEGLEAIALNAPGLLAASMLLAADLPKSSGCR